LCGIPLPTSHVFIVPSRPTSGHRTLELVGPVHRGHATWIDRVEGVKTFAAGQLSDHGGMTVSAEGVFIHPRD
ncbi:hypothetical protein ACK280_27045, partial [Mycobacterium sherrisii]